MNAQYKKWFKKEYNPDYSFSCEKTPVHIHHLDTDIVCDKFRNATQEVLANVSPKDLLAAFAYTTLECEHGSRTTYYRRELVEEL